MNPSLSESLHAEAIFGRQTSRRSTSCGISSPLSGTVIPVSQRQVIHALLTRSPLYSAPESAFLVRLACLIHAASIQSEPGSNSSVDVSSSATARTEHPTRTSRPAVPHRETTTPSAHAHSRALTPQLRTALSTRTNLKRRGLQLRPFKAFAPPVPDPSTRLIDSVLGTPHLARLTTSRRSDPLSNASPLRALSSPQIVKDQRSLSICGRFRPVREGFENPLKPTRPG